MEKLKWCIKRTQENYKEVNEWANKEDKAGYFMQNGFIHSEQVTTEDYKLVENKQPDFHEITLDEFRLLTDPEKWYVFEHEGQYYKKDAYISPRFPETIPNISNIVFNELQRMWKEREEPTNVYSKMCAELSELVKKMQDAMAEGKIISEADEKRAKELDSELKKIDSSIGRFTDRQTGNYTPIELKFMESDNTDSAHVWNQVLGEARSILPHKCDAPPIPEKTKNFIHQLKHELKQLKKGMKQIQRTIDKFEGKQF